MAFRQFILAAALALPVMVSTALAGPQLILVEQPGCAYCLLWDRQIAPAYPKTSEGQFAPLRRVQIRDGAPEGVTYARRVSFTPTFILVDNGIELARMEGYPGEDFFWPLLAQMLETHAGYMPDQPAPGN